MRLHHVAEGDGPALVLLGALGCPLALWEPELLVLAQRFRVVRVDHPGHGTSPVPESEIEIADIGAGVVAVLDELRVERASVCGLSLGGVVAMWLAAHAPERVNRVVLACTRPHFPPPEQWNERAALVRREGMAALADGTLARWLTPAAPPPLVAWVRGLLLSTPPEGYARCCEALRGADLRADVARIAAPALVLAAEQDPTVTPADAAALAAAIPSARLATIADAAHLASAERPAEFTRALVAHLG